MEHITGILGLTVLENRDFISVSADKTVIIWNSNTLEKTNKLIDVTEVSSVSEFSNDSFVTGNINGDIKIWSYFKEYKPIQTLVEHKDRVLALTVLNNVFLISASQDGTIIVWDNSFHSKIIQAHSRAVLALKFFSNRTLISCSEDKTIKTWNTQQYIFEKIIH
jgi:WD40 repeat protein